MQSVRVKNMTHEILLLIHDTGKPISLRYIMDELGMGEKQAKEELRDLIYHGKIKTTPGFKYDLPGYIERELEPSTTNE